jgi:hypothetical protein
MDNNKTWQFIIDDFFDRYYIINKDDINPYFATYEVTAEHQEMLGRDVNDIVKMQLAQTISKMILEKYPLIVTKKDGYTEYKLKVDLVEDSFEWQDKNKRDFQYR